LEGKVVENPDLSKFFSPKSIAIVGVSAGDSFHLGGLSYLMAFQDSRFAGPIYPINPKAREIRGVKAYSSLMSLPKIPELAIVCVPAPQVPQALEDCARIGVRHIHILTAGFKETGTREGKTLEEKVAAIARDRGLLVMGPNCMGPYCPSSGLTAWGARPGRDGPLGVISQSGGMTQRLTEYACSLGVGVRKAASIGNAAVLDSTDYLEFMAEDEAIRLIAMYIESVRDGRRLLKVARQVSPWKPIILLKGGQSEAGASTVASHTGTMAGEQRLWEGFFRQFGGISVRSMNEWADTILAFCHLTGPAGKGVFLVGGGGGNSVIHGDTCVREGLHVPELTRSSMEKLRRIVPAAGSIAGNPLDLWATFQDRDRLAQVLEIAYADPRIHMVIVDRLIPRKAFHMPDAPDSTAETIGLAADIGRKKPTVFTVDSDGGDEDLTIKGAAMRVQFCRAGIPAYPSHDRAVRAMAHLQRYYARFGTRPETAAVKPG
jgi:acyl-CoA synthetase (NDP forming)